jgi:hypothetical protein
MESDQNLPPKHTILKIFRKTQIKKPSQLCYETASLSNKSILYVKNKEYKLLVSQSFNIKNDSYFLLFPFEPVFSPESAAASYFA